MLSFHPSPTSEETSDWKAAEGPKLVLAPHLPDCEKNCDRRQLLRTLSGTAAPRGGSAGNGTETKRETQGGQKAMTDSPTRAASATGGMLTTAALAHRSSFAADLQITPTARL